MIRSLAFALATVATAISATSAEAADFWNRSFHGNQYQNYSAYNQSPYSYGTTIPAQTYQGRTLYGPSNGYQVPHTTNYQPGIYNSTIPRYQTNYGPSYPGNITPCGVNSFNCQSPVFSNFMTNYRSPFVDPRYNGYRGY